MKEFKTYHFSHIVASFVFIFALLIFGTAFYPAGWNWGFHFLSFYRLEIILVIPLLMLLILIPAIQESLIKIISHCTEWFSQQHRIVRIVIILTALSGLILLFWSFRVRSYFLGDGQLVLRRIQKLDSVDALALNFKREPLVGFFIVLLTNFFIVLKRSNPAGDAYCWLSILSGLSFAIIAWKLVKHFAKDRMEQSMLFFLLLSTGVSQQFFGYVENYAPSVAGILLFLLLGIAYLEGTIPIVWAMIVYMVVVILHFGALIFLPAFASLLYHAAKRKQIGEIGASLFLTGAVFFALLQLSQYPFELLKNIMGGTGHHLVAFSLPLNRFQAYNFFSLYHLLDVINFLMLSYPAAMVLLIISGIVIWRKRITIAIETRFLLLVALCGIVFIIVLNCEIGMSRDWDILAPISLGIPVAAVVLWKTIEVERTLRYRILMMLCVVSLLHTGLWVGVNSDESKAEERFKILEDDHLWSKHAHLDSYEVLAVYHRERGEYEKAIQYYQKYISLDSTNKRLWGNLANAYQLAGNKKKTIEVYETMMHLDEGDYQILTNLGILLTNEQRFSEALALLRRAEEYAPEDPIVKYNIGVTLMQSEQAYKKAIPYFLDAIQRDPTYSQAYYRAAQCYFMLGDSAKARQLMSQWQ